VISQMQSKLSQFERRLIVLILCVWDVNLDINACNLPLPKTTGFYGTFFVSPFLCTEYRKQGTFIYFNMAIQSAL